MSTVLSNLPRRRLLLGAAAAAIGGAAGVRSATAAHDDELDLLWREWLAIAAEARAVRAALEEAWARVPAWAKPGPTYVRHDGTLEGPIVHWPAIANIAPPENPIALRNVRPSPTELRSRYLGAVGWAPKAKHAELRSQYRGCLRSLAMRLRRRDEEQRKAGIPALEEKDDAIFDRRMEIEERIAAMRPTCSTVAALALCSLCSPADGNACHARPTPAFLSAMRIVEHARANLTGALAASVDDVVGAPDGQLIRGTAFWI